MWKCGNREIRKGPGCDSRAFLYGNMRRPSVRSEVDRLSERAGRHAFAFETDCETSNVAQKPSGNDNCKVCDNSE